MKCQYNSLTAFMASYNVNIVQVHVVRLETAVSFPSRGSRLSFIHVAHTCMGLIQLLTVRVPVSLYS